MKENNELTLVQKNEMLAKFIGYEGQHEEWCGNNILEYNPFLGCMQAVSFDPEKRWDQLMRIVEKIEKLHSSNFKYDMDKIASGDWPKDNEYMGVIALPLATPIAEVYEKIVGFITWYNSFPENQGEGNSPGNEVNKPIKPE